MTTAKNSERFLELEAQATELVAELGRLRRETIRYTQAATTLEQVAAQVNSMLLAQERLAEAFRDAVAVFTKLGVSDLLERADTVEHAVDHVGEGVSSLQAGVLDVQKSATGIENELAELKRATDKAELVAALSSVQHGVLDVQKNGTAVQNMLMELKSTADKSEQSISALDREVSESKWRVTAVERGFSDLNVRVAAVEQGVGDLVGRAPLVEKSLDRIAEVNARTATQVDSLLEYQCKGLLGRLFGKPSGARI